MRVHIIGPNLPDQSKGDFHVHAAGCADVRRNPDYRAPDFETDRLTTFDVRSQTEAGALVYADQINEEGMTAAEAVASLWFAPCCDALPTENQPHHIVIAGNPVDGLTHYGPFADHDAANDFAETLRDEPWWWITTTLVPVRGSDGAWAVL